MRGKPECAICIKASRDRPKLRKEVKDILENPPSICSWVYGDGENEQIPLPSIEGQIDQILGLFPVDILLDWEIEEHEKAGRRDVLKWLREKEFGAYGSDGGEHRSGMFYIDQEELQALEEKAR